MAIRVKTTETIILAIAIGAFSSSVPYAMAADRNNLESRTKFIIYDNKYANKIYVFSLTLSVATHNANPKLCMICENYRALYRAAVICIVIQLNIQQKNGKLA